MTTTPSSEVKPPAEPGPDRLSVLGQLKDRREQILQKEHLDLPVPRWSDPEIIVRYKPVPHRYFAAGQKIVEKAVGKDKAKVEVNANIDILIQGCTAVIARLDGQDYSLHPGDPKGDFTTFDPDLADNLGLGENATARETVMALFIVDGDIMSHAASLARFSGYREAEADEGVSGE
jgi:hypothetical protein